MWNVITKDNKHYPDTDKLVVGFFIDGAELYATLCRYLIDEDIWTDDYDCLMKSPDYWTELPDFEQELT